MGKLGEISFLNSTTAQALIHVSKDGEGFCFPWHKQFVKNIDAEIPNWKNLKSNSEKMFLEF